MTAVATTCAALLGALVVGLWARTLFGRTERLLLIVVEQLQRVERGEMAQPIFAGEKQAALRELDGALQRMARARLDAQALLQQQLAQQDAALAQARLHIEELTVKDALTGLPNRRRMQETLQAEILRHRRTGGTLSLILGCIDRFQEIHDALGAARCDEVIQVVAERLAGTCRRTDFVGRIDRNEFALLLPETGSDGAAVLARKLLLAVAAAPCADAGSVTLSLGVLVKVEIVGADDALSSARESMHQAQRRAQQAAAAHDKEAANPVTA